jgi:hypothetical protein
MPPKKEKQKEEKKETGSGAGVAIAGGLLSVGFLAVAAAIGYAIGDDNKVTQGRIRKLESKTRHLQEEVDDVDRREREGRVHVITPPGSYPVYKDDDIEA